MVWNIYDLNAANKSAIAMLSTNVKRSDFQ